MGPKSKEVSFPLFFFFNLELNFKAIPKNLQVSQNLDHLLPVIDVVAKERGW